MYICVTFAVCQVQEHHVCPSINSYVTLKDTHKLKGDDANAPSLPIRWNASYTSLPFLYNFQFELKTHIIMKYNHLRLRE